MGILSNPLVTLFYLAEQFSIFLYASTTRASDSRIMISLFVDIAAVGGLYQLLKSQTEQGKDFSMMYLIGIVAYLTSSNYMHTLCLKKPFQAKNEELDK